MFLEVLHELSDRRCTATISEMHDRQFYEFTEQEPAARDLEAVGDEASFRELVGLLTAPWCILQRVVSDLVGG